MKKIKDLNKNDLTGPGIRLHFILLPGFITVFFFALFIFSKSLLYSEANACGKQESDPAIEGNTGATSSFITTPDGPGIPASFGSAIPIPVMSEIPVPVSVPVAVIRFGLGDGQGRKNKNSSEK
jgi:hypothetical protein